MVTWKAIDVPMPRLLVAGQNNILDLTVYVDGVATDPDVGTMSLTLVEDETTLGTFTPTTSSGKMTATVTSASLSAEQLFDVLSLGWQFNVDSVEYHAPEPRVYLIDARAKPALHHSDLTDRHSVLADSNNLPSGKSNWQYVIDYEWIRVLEELAKLEIGYAHAALRDEWRLNSYLIPRCLASIFRDQGAYVAGWLDISKEYRQEADQAWKDLKVYLRSLGTTAFPLTSGGSTIKARQHQRMASTALDGGI